MSGKDRRPNRRCGLASALSGLASNSGLTASGPFLPCPPPGQMSGDGANPPGMPDGSWSQISTCSAMAMASSTSMPTYRALKLGVTEEQLDRPEISSPPIDERRFGPPHGSHRRQDQGRSRGVPVETVQVEDDSPYQAIIDTAESKGADLIVMSSHGRRGVSALILGSETTKVLTHCKILTVVRDGAQRPNCRRFSSLARSAAIASLVAKISLALAQPSLLIRYSQRIY
jgi:Universal stress protein family